MSNDKEKRLSRPKSQMLALFTYFAFGLLVTMLLIGLKLAVEHSVWGHDVELWVFGGLQGSLSPIATDNPIVLLDISDLAGGKPGQPTSRKALKEIIEALADQNPRAIAVDVDLSPNPDDYVTNEDPDFFDFCLDLRNNRKMPIFLAVGRTKAAPPEAWLGERKYAPLAVAVAVNKDDTSRMPLWVRAKGSSQELKMMSYALALEYRKYLPQAAPWIGWAVETNVEEPPAKTPLPDNGSGDSDLAYAAHLINFSKLELLKQSAQKDTSAESVRNTGGYYNKKLVILGDVSRPLDFFPVPGRLVNEGGVLLQACATYTLIKEPLFEFTPKVRLAIDGLLAVLVIGLVASIRYSNPDNSYWLGKQAILIYIVIAVVILSGWLLVRFSGVMWLDFLFVAGALFLHPKLEHWLRRLIGRIRRTRPLPKSPGGDATVAKALICAFALSLIFLSTARGQAPETLCQRGVAAFAVRLNVNEAKKKNKKSQKRGCYFQDGKNMIKNKLSATDAVKKQFREGQFLSCDKNCTLVIQFCGTGRQRAVTERLPAWVLNTFSSPEQNDRFKENATRVSRSFAPANPRSLRTTVAANDKSAVWGLMSRGRNNPAGARGVRSETAKEFAKLLETGTAARLAKHYALAENAFSAAHSLIPNDPRAPWGLGNIYADQAQWTKAEYQYRSALLLTLDPQLNMALGFVLLQPREGEANSERIAEAEQLFWAAATVEPENAEAYNLLYEALEKRQASLNEMETAYRRALRISSHSFDTNFRLSQLLRQAGQIDEANEYLRKADDLASNPANLQSVASAWEAQGKYERAESALRRTGETGLRDSSISLTLGRVQMLRKNYSQAVQSLQLAVSANPNGFVPKYMLGVAQLRAENPVEAERILDQAAAKADINTDDALAMSFALRSVGESYAAAGRLTDAVRLYERALRCDPQDQLTKEKLLEARAKLGH